MTCQPLSSDRIAALMAEHRHGYTLPQPFYTDDDILDLDVRRVFLRSWMLAGHVSEIPRPGDYLLLEVGRESIIVTRGSDGEVHAMFNVCRHRGARLCTKASGSAPVLVCPYHAWSYASDGRLIAARAMPAGFDPQRHELKKCIVRVLDGLVFVAALQASDDFGEIARDALPILAQHELSRTRVCHRLTWRVGSNWKLLVENFEECYHCKSIHPEYCEVMAHAAAESSGAADALRDFERRMTSWEAYARELGHAVGCVETTAQKAHWCGRFPMLPGVLTHSRSGQLVAPLLGTLKRPDGGTTSFRVYPASFVLTLNDYALMIRFLPASAAETRVEATWLVHEDAVEGRDFDPEELTWLWRRIVEQDNRVAELNQLGVESCAYVPGPYAEVEDYCVRFDEWYKLRLGSADDGRQQRAQP